MPGKGNGGGKPAPEIDPIAPPAGAIVGTDLLTGDFIVPENPDPDLQST